MFREGQQIGLYTLIRKLGRGGFGEVWLAKKDEEYFAIKLPYNEQIDWKTITQEIGLWVLCGEHKNVLPLVGAKNFNGQIAIISEYAPSGSLEDLLKVEGKLPIKEAVELTIEILQGLAHLHESGVIHRDLKPANILLDEWTPRLADFGISRIVSADSLSETVSGTWAYMAPECFDGKRNIHTDIWSVGVILYRMLSGKLPFPQKEQTALVGAIINREPKSLVDFLPKDLDKIVAKSLCKNISGRYRHASKMNQDLETFLQNNFIKPVEERRTKVRIEKSKQHLEKNLEKKEVSQLIPYKKGNNFGFCDSSKQIVIYPMYNFATPFYEGLSLVGLKGKYGLIDKHNQEIIPIKYNSLSILSEGRAWIKIEDKYGFIDKYGEPITSLKYSKAFSFREGFAKVQLNDKWGFINEKGKEICPFKYDKAYSFSEGRASVEINDKYGFIDKTGAEVISPKYNFASDFSGGLAKVTLAGKYGFIDMQGREVIPLKYNYVERFSEGLAFANLGHKYSFIDKNGIEVFSHKYSLTSYFSEGLVSVCESGFIADGEENFGFIDKHGNEIISPKYDYSGNFSEGLACVWLKDKRGYIDKTGKEITPIKYSSCSTFKDGLSSVWFNDAMFYIDKNGIEYFDD